MKTSTVPSTLSSEDQAVNQKPSIPSPERFRAQATGIGQTQAMSYNTGLARGSRVVATCPGDKKKFLKARGYPTGEGPQ